MYIIEGVENARGGKSTHKLTNVKGTKGGIKEHDTVFCFSH